MLHRAKRLSLVFDNYCEQHDQLRFKLNKDEWRQIDYLLCLTKPFYKFTTVLSKTKDLTIHNVFRVYNRLFDHFDASIRQLERKKVAWKKEILRGLNAGRAKLSEYYTKTDDMHRNLYAIGTILAPQHKLQFFSSREWGNDPEWRAKYKADLQEFMEPYQRRLSKTQLPVNVPRQKTSDMEDLFNDGVSTNATANAGFDDELAQYLESGMQCKTFYYEYPLILLNSLATKNVDPLVFWRDHQDEFPILASIARDVFSIPATGAGVERLFNSARDICHYRRGSLHATTIQDIMMFRCLSKFDIEDEDEAAREATVTQDEKFTAEEQKEAQLPQHTPDPISDDEESGDEESSDKEEEPRAVEPASQLQPQVPSEPRALGKRRKSVASIYEIDEMDKMDVHENYSDDDSILPLPTHQQRTSGRARKRPRQEDFEEY